MNFFLNAVIWGFQNQNQAENININEIKKLKAEIILKNIEIIKLKIELQDEKIKATKIW